MIPCRVPVGLMKQLTVEQERNIYIHPNPLAREIFWQRIERLGAWIAADCTVQEHGLDFGGGSGSLVRFWSGWGGQVDLLDLDCADAVRLKSYYSAGNVTVFEQNIASHDVTEHYDFVVAADVLEHFPQLDFPVSNIVRLLKPGGKLFISVPTENFLYEMGRKVVGKSKPADHYHPSAAIIAYLEASGFRLVRREVVPRLALVRVPLFDICLLQKG